MTNIRWKVFSNFGIYTKLIKRQRNKRSLREQNTMEMCAYCQAVNSRKPFWKQKNLVAVRLTLFLSFSYINLHIDKCFNLP